MWCVFGQCLGDFLPIRAENYRGLDMGGVLGDEPVYLRPLQLPAGNPYNGVEPF